MYWILGNRSGQVAGWVLKGGGEEGEKIIVSRRGSFPVVERLLRFRYKSGLCLGSVALFDDPGLGTTAKVADVECHPGKRLQRHRGGQNAHLRQHIYRVLHSLSGDTTGRGVVGRGCV
jgi:hypothetical protein